MASNEKYSIKVNENIKKNQIKSNKNRNKTKQKARLLR